MTKGSGTNDESTNAEMSRPNPPSDGNANFNQDLNCTHPTVTSTSPITRCSILGHERADPVCGFWNACEDPAKTP